MHYIVSYDIQEDKLRTKVMKYLKDCGYHLQKSVFIVDCVNRDRAMEIFATVKKLATGDDDRLFMAPFCQQCLDKRWQSGKAPKFDENVWIA